ncbi:hypothetical protein EVAR_51965_1 [Eumeta japonica]|uniref:Uncharacterized protein n=1 Tax=Eumeta variegata TaxID=151549 RepID=A0A4C1Y4P8_EUMVA|nr:hypothetical protein EVAR_51965_1 [Eumeta japonica]
MHLSYISTDHAINRHSDRRSALDSGDALNSDPVTLLMSHYGYGLDSNFGPALNSELDLGLDFRFCSHPSCDFDIATGCSSDLNRAKVDAYLCLYLNLRPVDNAVANSGAALFALMFIFSPDTHVKERLPLLHLIHNARNTQIQVFRTCRQDYRYPAALAPAVIDSTSSLLRRNTFRNTRKKSVKSNGGAHYPNLSSGELFISEPRPRRFGSREKSR